MERKFFIEGVSKHDIVDYLLAIKHDARATTFRRINEISQDELDWQPYEGWNSVGVLLSHIIALDYYFKIAFIETRPLTDAEKQRWEASMRMGEYIPQLKGKTHEYYLDELQKGYEMMRETIKNIAPEKLLERRYDVYDKVNGSDLAWILYHTAEDEVHHRGQISILRKLYKMRKP